MRPGATQGTVEGDNGGLRPYPSTDTERPNGGRTARLGASKVAGNGSDLDTQLPAPATGSPLVVRADVTAAKSVDKTPWASVQLPVQAGGLGQPIPQLRVYR